MRKKIKTIAKRTHVRELSLELGALGHKRDLNARTWVDSDTDVR